uniref:NADH dehydrogenase subunit 4 n=1 Tax=Marcia japonica TaxID=368935 RepID=UPI002238CA2B|nr:NADH dehydrogenase subunit 4 [Marcia japonica]UYR95105.1 NADH dehydrogenase subunit 4 [Marcia japonica]
MSMGLVMSLWLVFTVWGFGLNNIGLVVLVCSLNLILLVLFLPSFQFCLMSEWVGMDEMSFLMVVLSILVTMVSIVSSCKDMKEKEMNYIGGFNIMEMVGLVCISSTLFFLSCSWMDFYFFFELSLIPTFFLILKWGYRPERLQAGVYMIMYTVSSSLPLFMGLLWFWSSVGSDSMLLSKMVGSFWREDLGWPWLAMSLGFIVKLPMYGVHGWLPKAHVEAPLSGSMLLAGILLKFGGYGVIRFSWFVEIAMSSIIQFVLVAALWGGVLSSVICLCQSDLKSLIAYSSIGHMAMGFAGFLTFFSIGKMGFVCMMFAHGLCSPVLFSLAASSYDICSSRNILLTKGMLRTFPLFSTFWFLFSVINMGVPPSLNFFSEVFCLGSLVWMESFLSVPGGMMCFFAGCYCLVLFSLVNHGNISNLSKGMINLSPRYISSMVFTCFFLLPGSFFMDFFFV